MARNALTYRCNIRRLAHEMRVENEDGTIGGSAGILGMWPNFPKKELLQHGVRRHRILRDKNGAIVYKDGEPVTYPVTGQIVIDWQKVSAIFNSQPGRNSTGRAAA